MRVSTVTIFEQSMRSLNQQQADFSRVGEQIASGKRVVRPSDDPLAASRAVRTSQALGVTTQYADARVSARNALSQQEGILGSVTDTLTRARTLMVQASTGTLSDADRSSIASELRGLRETILGQANATDGNGTYLFGGYNDSSEPFVRDALTGDITYVGDSNSRAQRIDSSRLMPVTDNGITVFQSVHQGAGYVAEADGANTGSLTFNGPRVIDVTDAAYGDSFELSYDAGTDEFTITNLTTSTAQVVPRPASGDAILEFGGLSITLEGEPDDGDRIRIDLAANMNTDLFATLEKAIAVLDTSAETPEQRAKLANTSKTVMREIDNSLDNILTHRASVGARLNELDILDRVGENREINYTQNLSDLVDLNYVEAISEYSLRQVGLQAAQKAFVDVKGLSLFNYM